MAKEKLTNTDFCRAAKRLKVEVAAIKAVASVESAGNGFLSDGRCILLFERHHFARLTRNKFNADFPQISSKTPGGYYGMAKEYQRFNAAFALDPDAAMKSSSWGKFQILGSNHAVCGYATVDKFVDAQRESEAKQLDAFCGFVEGNNLTSKLRNLDWAGFARGYNGPAYKKNSYDTKMAAAYRKFAKENIDCSNSTAAPRRLTHDGAALAANAIIESETTEPANSPATAAVDSSVITLEPVAQPFIEVAQVSPEPEKPKDPPKEDPVLSIGNRVSAIWTAAGATVVAIGAFLTTTPLGIAVSIVGAIAFIGVCYMLINATRNNAKEKRDHEARIEREKQEAQLKAAREDRAFQLQKITLTAAADPTQNAVVISQPPPVELVNSDSNT